MKPFTNFEKKNSLLNWKWRSRESPKDKVDSSLYLWEGVIMEGILFLGRRATQFFYVG